MNYYDLTKGFPIWHLFNRLAAKGELVPKFRTTTFGKVTVDHAPTEQNPIQLQ